MERLSRCWWPLLVGEARRNAGSREGEEGVEVQELIDALDQRILDAIAAKATGETIVRLCEARAWLTNPAQAHLNLPPSSS